MKLRYYTLEYFAGQNVPSKNSSLSAGRPATAPFNTAIARSDMSYGQHAEAGRSLPGQSNTDFIRNYINIFLCIYQ